MLVSFHDLAKLELNEAAEDFCERERGAGTDIHHRGRALHRRNHSDTREQVW